MQHLERRLDAIAKGMTTVTDACTPLVQKIDSCFSTTEASHSKLADKMRNLNKDLDTVWDEVFKCGSDVSSASDKSDRPHDSCNKSDEVASVCGSVSAADAELGDKVQRIESARMQTQIATKLDCSEWDDISDDNEDPSWKGRPVEEDAFCSSLEGLSTAGRLSLMCECSVGQADPNYLRPLIKESTPELPHEWAVLSEPTVTELVRCMTHDMHDAVPRNVLNKDDMAARANAYVLDAKCTLQSSTDLQ